MQTWQLDQIFEQVFSWSRQELSKGVPWPELPTVFQGRQKNGKTLVLAIFVVIAR